MPNEQNFIVYILMAAFILVLIVVKTASHYLKHKTKRVVKKLAPEKILPGTEALMRTIAEKKKTDPLIALKLGGKEVVSRLRIALTDEKGISTENLLGCLGAYAGYICQASVRAEYVENKGLPENKVFTIVGCANGKKYYFGDLLNKPLAENQYSIWGLGAGMAQHLGASELIDVNEIFKYVTETVGKDDFGIPRIKKGFSLGISPINIAKDWKVWLPLLDQFCDQPAEWPILFGMAIQEAIHIVQNIIVPNMALSIVMECAIPMSKVDLTDL